MVSLRHQTEYERLKQIHCTVLNEWFYFCYSLGNQRNIESPWVCTFSFFIRARAEFKVEGIAVLTICNLSEGRIISCYDYREGENFFICSDLWAFLSLRLFFSLSCSPVLSLYLYPILSLSCSCSISSHVCSFLQFSRVGVSSKPLVRPWLSVFRRRK